MNPEVVISIINTLSEQYGTLGKAITYFVFFSPLVSVLLQVSNFLATFTETKEDDHITRKILFYWDIYVDPVLSLIPRINIPVARWLQVLIIGAARLQDYHRKKSAKNAPKTEQESDQKSE